MTFRCFSSTLSETRPRILNHYTITTFRLTFVVFKTDKRIFVRFLVRFETETRVSSNPAFLRPYPGGPGLYSEHHGVLKAGGK